MLKEIIRKLSKHEIKIRQTVSNRMQGNFHSIFKGTGIEFDDIRAYQYGDDVRSIDWAVTAKGHGTYVKTYKEEKEQQVLLLLDVSASQAVGNHDNNKLEIAKEICGILALSAVKENSDVGLICYSNQKELYVKPNKGHKHALNLIKRMYELIPKSKETNLNAAISYALTTLKRHSVVILVSDFLDKQYEKLLKALAADHDLVVIHLSDSKELNFPKLGTIPILNKENGKTIWVNTFSKMFRKTISDNLNSQKQSLQGLCNSQRAAYLWLNTNDNYLAQLVKLFKVRNNKK